MKYIEKDFPIKGVNKIAKKATYYKRPIYQIHKWWARRLGCVFRAIILSSFIDAGSEESELWRKYYQSEEFEGKLVLDPFMGGGTTVVEALRLGCNVIGMDLNPVAWFVTKKEIESVNLKKMDEKFKQLKENVGKEIKKYYKTLCPKCAYQVDVMYVFWVRKAKCVSCGTEVPLHKNFRLGRKNDVNFLFCPSCGEIFKDKHYKEDVNCPSCGENFIPSKGYTRRGGYYVCPNCGQKEEILTSIRRREKKPKKEMFAIQYYCEHCEEKSYKKPSKEDKALYEEAKKEFEEKRKELMGNLIPDQEIPPGYNTKQARNFFFRYFWQMFNKRQLLCLSSLLRELLKIKDKNIREFFLLTFSDCLNANNMFCKYNTQARKLEPLYGRQVYWPPMTPIENNLWGTKYGRGSFENYYKKTRRGKEFAKSPYERKVSNDETEKIYPNDKIKGKTVEEIREVTKGKRKALLKAQTSEDLSFIPDSSIDAVITDPPYYDNIMYSEIADFFYVWLHLGLKQEYKYFEGGSSPRSREIIKNPARWSNSDKAEKFYVRGLTRVLKECRRVLKDEGLMVFTFHHEETEAWASTLEAILESGFQIKATYPIQAEGKRGAKLGNITYDVIVVCEKQKKEKSVSWEKLKDEIYRKIEKLVSQIRKSDRGLSDIDLFVVAMGKGEEYYSKYYPNVLKNGEKISVREAIRDIQDFVQPLVKTIYSKELPSGIDHITRIYVSYFVGQEEVSYNDLSKRLSKAGFSTSDVLDEKLLKKEDNTLTIVEPEKRREIVKRKMEKGKSLNLIDKIHYLYAFYEQGEDITSLMEKWGGQKLKSVCVLLYKKTADKIYKKIGGIADLTPKKEGEKTLEEYIEE